MKALKRCFWVLLCFGFISLVWAQNQEEMTRPGRHLTPQHRMANPLSKGKRMAQPGSLEFGILASIQGEARPSCKVLTTR